MMSTRSMAGKRNAAGRAGIALLGALLLLAGAPAASADSGGPSSTHTRFSGGSYDGFDSTQELRTTTDWDTFRARLTRRFRGGANGGYAQSTAMGESLVAKGTMFMFR